MSSLRMCGRQKVIPRGLQKADPHKKHEVFRVHNYANKAALTVHYSTLKKWMGENSWMEWHLLRQMLGHQL